MNFYKKINAFILERYPTMWNTHFIWILCIGLLTHLLYFVTAYLSLDIHELKQYGISSYFFRGLGFSLYIIIGLITFIYFAFRYYTHNPFRHFYPLAPSYFWKIFAQLFTLLFVYASVFISYENGLLLKAKKLTPVETIVQEIHQVNLAYPFLFNNLRSYHIENRVYPKPFPLDDVSSFVIGHDSINDVDIKHEIDHHQPYLHFNGNEYQFGKIKSKEIDSCTSTEYIDSIIDISHEFGIAEYSLFNFKNLYIEQFVDTSFDYNRIAPIVFTVYKSKDKASIEKYLQNLVNICNKYNIGHTLNPSKMANAILTQDLNNKAFVRTGFYDFRDQIIHTEESNEAVASDDPSTPSKIKYKKDISYNYSADLRAFSTLAENVTTLNTSMAYHELNKDSMWGLIIFVFFITLLLLLTKYVPLKEILIGIVITGILSTILACSVFIVIESNHNYDPNQDTKMLFVCLLFACIIIALGLYGIFSAAIKKSYVFKWFLPTCISILSALPVIYFFVHQMTAYKVPEICSNDLITKYLFELSAWHFLVLELVGVFIIFKLLRKLHAKAS